MLIAKPELDARDVARVMRVLRSVDKELVADLRTSLRTDLKPVGKAIESKINGLRAPMSGMMREGVRKPNRTAWGRVSSSVSITPGTSRRNTNIVSININASKAVGIAIAENAGTKSRGKDARGASFIRRIEWVVPGWPNGGRFVYRTFMPFKSSVYAMATDIINRWSEKTSRELERIQ